MKKYKLLMQMLLLILFFSSCEKNEFLNKKPSSSLVVPKALADLQALLDNTNRMNSTGGLAQLSGDDYFLTDANYNSESGIASRYAYIWAKDVYGGEVGILDWNNLYTQVFYANAVLEGLESIGNMESEQSKYLKGWALFARSYAFYDLTRNFCKAYDKATASSDLGIPLRLQAGIDYVVQRASLQNSFDRILDDLALAETLLPSVRPSVNLNRPSKIAVYALLARIYLDMRDYEKAEIYAEKCLNIYSVLIDYKTVNKTSVTPFSQTNDELIYNSWQVATYGNFTGTNTSTKCKVSPVVLGLYTANDLRLTLYFNRLTDNTYTVKRGYVGFGNYPFTGLATDEVYLIKAECLARRNETTLSMDVLNQMMVKRWDPNATVPAKPYVNISAGTKEEALEKVLLERRKELVWRGLRWHDLKRLNKEGANLTLTRVVNGVDYTIPANDLRWVFPIPDDEIGLSGIQQNIR